MTFYDLHIHTNQSIGEDSIENIIHRARELGLTGIGVSKYFGTESELVWNFPEVAIDLVSVAIVKARNADELNEAVKIARKRAVIVAVHGGDYDINRASCENSMVDLLLHPELGRKDSGLDHICIREAAENNVAIEINFREVLETFRKQRVYVLSSLRKNINLCKKYDAKLITTSSALSIWDLRSGRELASIPHLLGMDLSEAIATVSTIPQQLVTENREKLLNKRWEGVTIVEDSAK